MEQDYHDENVFLKLEIALRKLDSHLKCHKTDPISHDI